MLFVLPMHVCLPLSIACVGQFDWRDYGYRDTPPMSMSSREVNKQIAKIEEGMGKLLARFNNIATTLTRQSNAMSRLSELSSVGERDPVISELADIIKQQSEVIDTIDSMEVSVSRDERILKEQKPVEISVQMRLHEVGQRVNCMKSMVPRIREEVQHALRASREVFDRENTIGV